MTRAEAQRLLTLAREAELFGANTSKWVDRLEPERGQLVAAARFLAENGEEDAAAELAAGVWRLWLLSGDVAEGRKLLAGALDVGDPTPSRARALALYGDGALAFRAGAQRDSLQRNEAALEAARAVGDREAESLALVGLSRVAFRDGDYARVRALATEALQLARDLDEAARVAPLHLLAAGTRLAGDYDEAVELYSESLELNRRLGDSRMVGMELHNIGHIEVHLGNTDAAERYFAERTDHCSDDDPYDAAMTHLNRAAVAFMRADGDRAADELRATRAALDGAGIVLDPDDAFEVDWLADRLDA